ncbi:MAG: hypothetical protein HQ510_00975, partial [Candidatus Marinimicrobia bacterium]|nr:hypothetical protein [Candidatus Neomarinimicrobiota bacterium]
MTVLIFILKSLRFYWRSNLWVLSGVIIGAIALTGALVVGTSVETSLVKIAEMRLGKTDYALIGEDVPFRSALAQDVSTDKNIITAAILSLKGTLIHSNSGKKLINAAVLGIDSTFWSFCREEFNPVISGRNIAVNARAAKILGVQRGDRLILRVGKDLITPLDIPISTNDDGFTSFPVTISEIVDDNQMGRFDFRSNQVSPANIFIDREYLIEKLDVPNISNIILVAGDHRNVTDELSIDKLNDILQDKLHTTDLNLNIRKLSKVGKLEITSKNVFFNSNIYEQLLEMSKSAERVFTYFVNEIRHNTQSIPYSFVAGIENDLYPNLANNEILINNWAAQELDVSSGDTLVLKYFTLGISSELLEDSTAFVVKDVIPMKGFAGDPTLMPDFNGLSDSENCKDWHPGIPVDLDLITKRDEDYWDQHKGTPKAFINIDTARRMWTNRFGDLTSIRFSVEEYSIESLSKVLLMSLKPEQLGFKFLPVREQAITGARDGVDFG